jgi:LAS superfamily LD-carboxypeptidase LdcB
MLTQEAGHLAQGQHLNLFMQEQVLLLYQKCAERGIHFEIASGKRDYLEQKTLFEQYSETYSTDKIGIPGTSRHEAGLAVDLIINGSISYTESYAEVGRLWEGMGFTWGQNSSRDEYWHFEISYQAYFEALTNSNLGEMLPQPAF